ncbi:MAG: hypothetical protein ABSD48_11215 [Armatimonadota bacterium]
MAGPTVQECLRANASKLIWDERMRAAVHSMDHAEYGAWRCEDADGLQSELVDFWVMWGRAVLSLTPRPVAPEGARDTAGIELGPGSRVYFRCPRCWRRAQDLYLYGSHFWCRRCHGLVYASQQEDRPQWLRRARQAEAAARRAWIREMEEKARRRQSQPGPDWERRREEIQRQVVEESREWARRRRLRYVQRTGRPGRPREKRHYHHDDSRRVKLQPGEAYCCRCRAARPYRYPRSAELICGQETFTAKVMDTRTAIRARCRVCNAPVFRIVHPEEAEGLQEFWWGG